MKRMMAFLLAAVLVMSLLAGCGGGGSLEEKKTTEAEQTTAGDAEGTEEGTEGGEESTEAPKYEITYPLENACSLTWFTQDGGFDLHGDYTDASESPLHNYLKVATGVDIQWQLVPLGANSDTTYNLVLEESPLPNIMTGNSLRYEELYEDGMIYDLTPYLEEYAPDYWAWLNKEENENILKALKLDDGAIVAFICIIEDLNCYSQGPLLRKDWLDECGLDIPYTLEEWEEVLIAFRDRYGIAPLSGIKPVWRNLYGLASGTNAHGGMKLSFYVEDGTIKCAQLQEEWKELITILARWYKEGLIDPDVGTVTKATMLPKAAEGLVGLALTDEAQATRIPLECQAVDPDAEWIAIPCAVPEKGDPVVYGQYEGTNIGHATVITTDCTEEELITAIKLLNYGYSDEGMITYNFGEQGVTWEYDANGEIQLTELVTGDPSGKTSALVRYSPLNDGIAPAVKMNRFAELRYDATTLEAFENWGLNSQILDYKVPALRYTTEEKATRADLVTRLETFLEPYATKCIFGEIDLEANWEAFQKELYSLGLEEVMQITQDAYDRLYK